MRSAESLGTATKPINLFYGLSQGARAIAAASMSENDGRLSGHGIGLRGALSRDLLDIEVQDRGGTWGAFTSIAKLMKSPSLAAPVSLGDLLAALPLTLPPSSWAGRPSTLAIEHEPQNSASHGIITRKIYARSGPWPDLPGLQEGPTEDRRACAAAYLDKHYPDLRGLQPMPEGREYVPLTDGGRSVVLLMELENGTGSDAVRAQSLYAHTIRVGGSHLVPPLLGDARPPHPMVILWACLWTLSMLARYEPVRWVELVDVDRSGDATALEELLEDALDLVPLLLVDALE